MKDRHDEDPQASPDEQRFIRELSEQYAPDPPSAARAQAFDAALRERLEAPVRESWWRPALVTAIACAAVGWLLLPATRPEPKVGDATTQLVQIEPVPARVALEGLVDYVDAQDSEPLDSEPLAFDPLELDWDAEIFSASEVTAPDETRDEDFLPDEYLAIQLWLDG